MHLQQCLHPVRIFNKYTKEFQYVPCGKCESCRNAHSSLWTKRLDMERKSWKYCLFVTLTYSPEHLPTLSFLASGSVACCQQHGVFSPDKQIFFRDVVADLRSDLSNMYISQDTYARNISWLQNNCKQGIGILSRYHCQLFIKRLRKNLKNAIKSKYKDSSFQDYLVRYAIAGEYGETTYRPHYHCLFFFSSEKEAAEIESCVRQSWKLGLVDSSFVANSNARYVAAYLNGFANLPKVFQYREVRPFLLTSKCPPIGTLSYDDQEVREMFDSASPTQIVVNNAGNSVIDVPLWRCYKDRLFPRLPYFSQFSHTDRIALYRAFERLSNEVGIESASGFADFMVYHYHVGGFNRFYLQIYHDYIDTFLHYKNETSDVRDFLVRWCYVSARVFHQSCMMCIPIVDYISKIETFYDNVEKYNLRQYFKFQQDYSLDWSASSLIGMDRLYLSSLIALQPEDISMADRQILEGYGVDLKRFLNEDDSIRKKYQYTLVPDIQQDFLAWSGSSIALSNKLTKNKKKNDYLKKQDSPALYNLSNF